MDTEVIQLTDERRLGLLNRNERREYFSNEKALPAKLRRLTVINLLRELKATSEDGTEILNKAGNKPPLKEIVLFALRSAHNSDNTQGYNERRERYLLIKRIEKVDTIALNEKEKTMLKERIAKFFLQAEIVGEAGAALDEEIVESAPAPKPEAVGAPFDEEKTRGQ